MTRRCLAPTLQCGSRLGQGFSENVTLYSQLAQSSAQRLGQGESVGDIIKDSAFEMGANALTVGTYGTLKEQFSTAADYLSGNASIEQVESRLIDAAGGAVLNAALGSAGAKVAGEGFDGEASLGAHSGHGSRERGQTAGTGPVGGQRGS